LARRVVASAADATGFDAADGEHLFVADGAEAMASSVTRLFDDPAMADRMGKAARERMVARYGWDARLAPLRELLGLEG
ncbi:MAG: glycosyltransferase family protein, partial [Sphingopyxis sp.]